MRKLRKKHWEFVAFCRLPEKKDLSGILTDAQRAGLVKLLEQKANVQPVPPAEAKKP